MKRDHDSLWASMDKKSRKHLLVGIVAAMMMIGLIIILSVVSIRSQDKSHEKDAGVGTELEEKSAVFENRYQVDRTFGRSSGAMILEQVEEMIFLDEEMAAAPNENQSSDEFLNHYLVTINETSMKKYTKIPYVYTFMITISDGRAYTVLARQDSETNGDGMDRQTVMTTVLSREGRMIYQTSASNEELQKTISEWFDGL